MSMHYKKFQALIQQDRVRNEELSRLKEQVMSCMIQEAAQCIQGLEAALARLVARHKKV